MSVFQIIVIVLLGLIEAGGIVAYIYVTSSKRKEEVRAAVDQVREQVTAAEELRDKFVALLAEMVPMQDLAGKAKQHRSLNESLKVERGRITITQAELETVENRLRELEEIERELEASGVETKEELKILEKKEKEIREKNDALKARLDQSLMELDRIFSEIEISAQSKQQIENMKSELLRTQQQIDTLLLQVELGNEQYLILKRRYDALDIEYAQLYEKFAEVETASSEGGES